jgi:hypothetical protein
VKINTACPFLFMVRVRLLIKMTFVSAELDQKILVLASWARNVINTDFKPRLQQIGLSVGQTVTIENAEAAVALVEPMERVRVCLSLSLSLSDE